MPDHLVRALAEEGTLRVVAAVTTDTAREGARRHGCVGAASVALGRGLTAGLVLATLTKGDERVTVQILGDGPLGGVTAAATDAGDVRGYVHNPAAYAAAGGGRRIALAAAIGHNGVVNVLRDLGLKEQYSGQVRITTGEIDEDVETYLRVSEQIDSALGCEVLLSDAFEIAASAGILVQTMPGSGAQDTVRAVQHRLRTGLLNDLLGEPMTDAADIARRLLGPAAADLRVLDRRPVRFACTCSQERVADMLTLLGPGELEQMIAEDKGAEVTCNYCNTRYLATTAQLRQVRDNFLATKSRHGQA